MRCTQGKTRGAAILPTTWGSCLTQGPPGWAGAPAVGLGGGAWCEVAGDEGMQAGGRVVGHFVQADAAWASPTVLHLDGTDDQHLALVGAATTAGHGIVLT